MDRTDLFSVGVNYSSRQTLVSRESYVYSRKLPLRPDLLCLTLVRDSLLTGLPPLPTRVSMLLKIFINKDPVQG